MPHPHARSLHDEAEDRANHGLSFDVTERSQHCQPMRSRGNSAGPISQGEKAMKVQLVALVFALTLYACTRTQITLSGAAVGGVAGAAVAGPIGAAAGAGTGAS